jgi:hypothetical protein
MEFSLTPVLRHPGSPTMEFSLTPSPQTYWITYNGILSHSQSSDILDQTTTTAKYQQFSRNCGCPAPTYRFLKTKPLKI